MKVRPLYSTVEQEIIENEEKIASARDDDHRKGGDDLRKETKKQNISSRYLPVGFRVLASKPFVYSTIHADMGACHFLIIDVFDYPSFTWCSLSAYRLWQCTPKPPTQSRIGL